MTSAEFTDMRIAAPSPKTHDGFGIWAVFGATFLALMLASLPNLLDPMIRHDDYPAYFADGSWFWSKTLTEGRWLNYLWHLREVVTPAWLNFAVYQALWAGFAAALGAMAVGQGRFNWFSVVLALAVVVAPPAVLISLWFNTLIPGLALVTLYAVLAGNLRQWQVRALLPVFVVATFMAYTTYPLLLLIIAMLRTEKRSLIDLFKLLALFTASFIGAVLVAYTLNWQFHGIFGVPLADWREAAAASDLAGAFANLPTLWTSFAMFLEASTYKFTPAIIFHISLFFLSLALLARRVPLEALYIAAVMFTGLSLVAVQVMKMGALVPPRAFIFAWVIYVLVVVRAAQELSRSPAMSGRMMRNAALLIVGSHLLYIFQQYMIYRDWQGHTQMLTPVVEQSEGPVFVSGDASKSEVGLEAGLQDARGLLFRMEQLTGEQLVPCEDDPEGCARVLAATTDAGSDSVLLKPGVEVRRSAKATLLIYPEGDQ